MIRKAKFTDIDAIIELTKACGNNMIEHGIFQWNDDYPNKNAFENDVARKELFVLEKNNRIIGSIVISTFMDEDYESIQWLTENMDNVYIHRLAIHPNEQGKGFAQKLMDFAETRSRERKMQSIRLDTFSQNHRNQKFYELRGYQRLGNVYFPNQSEHPFYCYELVL